MPAYPAIIENSTETAGKGFFQSITKTLDYTLGSPDLLVLIGIALFGIILAAFFFKRR